MYVLNGKRPYNGISPKDTSVKDADSAIAHEYRQHLDPVIKFVGLRVPGHHENDIR